MDQHIKPKKPYKQFPLFPHATRRWAKKVRGKTLYFGPWDDPDGALALWLEQRDELLAGLVPRARVSDAGVTLRELCERFLGTKNSLVATGELSSHSYRDYGATCERLLTALGPGRLLEDVLPEDFERLRSIMALSWGPVRLGNKINEVRVVFNYAYKSGLVDRPVRYGEGFRRPSKATLRRARADKGPRLFEAAEIRRLLKAAGQPLAAMILLGINAGLGNEDVGRLPSAAIDLGGGWLNYPRPKTGVARRCPLWPETAAALRKAMARRPEPATPADAGLAFLTAKGASWAKGTSDNPVSKETRKLLNQVGIAGNRNFYALRHTFETVGGGTLDQVAVNAIMGHVDSSMAAAYREGVADGRLRVVADHVRVWLFGAKKAAPQRVRKSAK